MLQRAIVDAHEVDGVSLLLDVEIRDEWEANNAIATGAVGTFDNIEGSVGRKENPLRDEWGNYRK
jgi:hypothetical protein